MQVSQYITYHRNQQEEELKDAILLVFANKQDAKGAQNAQQVRFQCIDALIHYIHRLISLCIDRYPILLVYLQ